MICTPKQYLGDYIKKDELYEPCNLYEKKENTCKVQVQKCKRKILAGRHKCRLKDITKFDLNEMSWKFMDWINVLLILIFSQTDFKLLQLNFFTKETHTCIQHTQL